MTGITATNAHVVVIIVIKGPLGCLVSLFNIFE